MLKKKVPPRLWDFGFTWVCETENICANFSKHAQGRTPLEIITGETPDISEYLDFEFYDWVTFRSNAGLGEVQLGRWLGVSHRVGRLNVVLDTARKWHSSFGNHRTTLD